MKGHVPYSIEVRIRDEKGKRIYHWRDGSNNLALGMKQTTDFITEKLNVDLKELEAKIKTDKESKIKRVNSDMTTIKENTKKIIKAIESK